MDNINKTELSQSINRVNHYYLENNKIVGSVVMVAKQGQIIYQQASGYANKEQKIKMNIDSVFLLSSVTKPIVIAALLLLVKQGVFNLQSAVTEFLPKFEPKMANGQKPLITLHHLLTHTAGLSYRFSEPYGQGEYNVLQISDGFDDIYISLEENLLRLSQAILLYQPGTNWSYSLSIDVLGAVIEAATNKSLEAIIKELITTPLGMINTRFTLSHNNDLVTHYFDAKPIPKPMTNSYQMQLPESWSNGILSYAPNRIYNKIAYHSAGAGMVGNAPDFMTFILNLTSNNNKLSSIKLIDIMAQCYVTSERQTQGPGWGFGYGGAILDDPYLANTPQSKGTIQWGGVYGHTWFYDPKNDLAVVILTNTAIEGLAGSYPVEVRNAIYKVL